MTARRKGKGVPPPDVKVLAQRFSMGGGVEPQQAPESSRGSGKSEPDGMVRKTYYLPEDAATALQKAVDRIHHGSQGTVPKNRALAEIIRAGVERVDEIVARLTDSSH